MFYRHTKNRKTQVIPLCSAMVSILREYLRHRGGEAADFLFCTETGSQLTENGLRQSIARYNTRRGVQKTSIHLFRHTIARKYLIDCGGDAFTLQKLLGHSTLAMTKHYWCDLRRRTLTKNYDNFSPLAQMKSNSTRIKMDREAEIKWHKTEDSRVPNVTKLAILIPNGLRPGNYEFIRADYAEARGLCP